MQKDVILSLFAQFKNITWAGFPVVDVGSAWSIGDVISNAFHAHNAVLCDTR